MRLFFKVKQSLLLFYYISVRLLLQVFRFAASEWILNCLSCRKVLVSSCEEKNSGDNEEELIFHLMNLSTPYYILVQSPFLSRHTLFSGISDETSGELEFSVGIVSLGILARSR